MSSYQYAETKGTPGAPLVFTFHGTGGDEHQFHDLATRLVPGAHVVSARGDVTEFGAARYFRRKAEGVYDMQDLAERTGKMADFMAATRARTGADRVMAFGYSNGANILASVLMDHPGIVDQAALLHPLIPWQPQPRPELNGKRVLVTAGLDDPICPPAMTRQLNAWLTAQGVDLSEVWTRGGHSITNQEAQALQTFLQS